MIRFDLSITLDYTVLTPSDFVFIIQPTNTPYQRVTWEWLSTEPGLEVARGSSRARRPTATCACAREPGRCGCATTRSSTWCTTSRCPPTCARCRSRSCPPRCLQYIYPSRYCQSDRLLDVARAEFGTHGAGLRARGGDPRLGAARTRFQIGSSHPGTSALDTYECATGVCRDFAHLMISVCRALNIPARLATGIDYGADPALGPTDFHCYVEAYLGDRWYIFDPSGISPRMGLLRIGTGRDASRRRLRDDLRHGAVDHAAHLDPRRRRRAQRHRRAVPPRLRGVDGLRCWRSPTRRCSGSSGAGRQSKAWRR